MTETGIIAALALALPKLEGAKKDRQNPHFKANYATLGSVIDALDPLKEHGLWFLQVSHERDNGACFETFAIHGPSNTQMSMGTMFVPADRNNAQGFGSAQSYCRRYGLMAAFGLAAEDDDGNAASQSPAKPAQQRQQAKPADVISDDQRAELMLLMDQLNVPAASFLAYGKLTRLDDLPVAHFNNAKKWIMAEAKRIEAFKAKTLAEELGDEIKF